MHVPLVDLRAEYLSIKDQIDNAINNTISKCEFIWGEDLEKFEREFSEFCGVKHAIGTSSGTAAIYLSLLALGVGENDEVLTTPVTFIATAEAISWTHATPVFVDIDPQTWNINPNEIKNRITKKTKAIVVVHLYGQPCDMSQIMQIAKEYDLKVIEDCAQAHGAVYDQMKVGSIGDIGAFSFFPAKNLGAFGDGGIVVTNSDEVCERVRLLRNHGRKDHYFHVCVGFNYRLDNLQAAILRVKLKYLPIWNARRRKIAQMYTSYLEHIPSVSLQKTVSFSNSPQLTGVYYSYGVRILRGSRDRLREKLREIGIETAVHYPIPLHLQPAYKHLNYKEGSLKHAENFCREILNLPIHPQLTDEQVEYVATSLSKFLAL